MPTRCFLFFLVSAALTSTASANDTGAVLSKVWSTDLSPSALGLHCVPNTGAWWPGISNQRLAPQRLLPRDCVVAQDNPPVWAWPAHPQALASKPPFNGVYRFRLRRLDGDWVFEKITPQPYLHLPGAAPLAAGDYAWDVQWLAGEGAPAPSATMRLRVDASSRHLLLKSPAQALADARAQPRPRLLPRDDAWQRIRHAALSFDGARHDVYLAWRQWAEALPEPSGTGAPARGSAPSDAVQQYKQISAAYHATTAMRRDILRLSVLGHVAQEPRWLQAAVRRLMILADWPVDGATSEVNHRPANREAVSALAIGYDLLFQTLSPAQREQVERVLAQRIEQQFTQTFASLEIGQAPYNSHGVTGATHAAAATVLMAGTGAHNDAMAERYLAWLIPNLLTWTEQDGSDANGHVYGWTNLLSALPALHAIEQTSGLALRQRAALRNAPLWHEAFTPTPTAELAQRGGYVPAFGDGADPSEGHLHEYHATTSRWLADLLPPGAGRQVSARLWQSAVGRRTVTSQQDPLFLITPLPQEAPPGPAATQHVRLAVFADSGLVAMHSSLRDPLRSSLYLRASRFGSFNHSMADNGSFVLWTDGQPMLVNSGYYDFYMSPHHARYARHTRAKNALTIDGGRGQAELGESGQQVAQAHSPTVRLLNVAQDDSTAFASVELHGAYVRYREDKAGRPLIDAPPEPLLTHYRRAIVQDIARKIVVVIDVAHSRTPRRYELNFHSLRPWQRDALTPADSGDVAGEAWRTSHATARLCLTTTAGQRSLNIHTHDRFTDGPASEQEVLPSRVFQRQHHLVAATTGAAPSFRAVTVLRENCDVPPPRSAWNDQGSELTLTFADGATWTLSDWPAPP